LLEDFCIETRCCPTFHIKNLDSGIADFPSLVSAKIFDLRIDSIEKTEDCIKLSCRSYELKRNITVYLRDIWSNTLIDSNSSLRLIDPKIELVADWTNGLVVVNSDILVACTSISQGVFCKRKVILGEKYYTSSEPNKYMLLGNILHSLFQIAVYRTPRYLTKTWLLYVWRRELRSKFMEPIIALDWSSSELIPYMESIVKWITTYMVKPYANNKTLPNGSTIQTVMDIEENIHFPLLGIKGKVDVRTKDGTHLIEPLELKTRKSGLTIEYTAQILLYCLALSSQGTIGNGTILFLKDGNMDQICPKAADLKGIIHMRNELAKFVCSENVLPKPLPDPHFCSSCSYSLTCSLLQRTFDNLEEISGSMQNFVKILTSHLNDEHLRYFAKWVHWIFLEWKTDHSLKSKNMFKMVTKQRYIVEKDITLSFKDNVINRFKSNQEYFFDKHENFSNHLINLSNVTRIMKPKDEESKVRELIIDLRMPKFDKVKKSDLSKISDLLKILNQEQARAVLKSLMAKDYLIVQGFPGSGKTTTIVILLQCLLILDRSVLLTAYTHSAVDNILLKLMKVKFLINLPSNRSQKFVFPFLSTEFYIFIQFCYNSLKICHHLFKFFQPIIACTCLSIPSSHFLLNRRFSVTIVDEASLIVESALLPALSKSDTFILVGDPLQLSPLVKSRIAKLIAKLSSELFYDNKLACADDAVAESRYRSLSLENIDLSFLCMSNRVNDAIVFLDTQSTINSQYRMEVGADPRHIWNNGEIQLIKSLCDSFFRVFAGVKNEDIGVIGVYRYHSDMLKCMLDNVEVNTIDQYQGKEKSIIILSLVWTEDGSKIASELLADQKRINVAITRAKHKLILIGCRHSMMRFVRNLFLLTI
uniref:DNA replication ATP-dependent helicase/nuclease n=1 Tax=Dracunculus medinensis TaxID=318479 RepID=A0A0N4UJX3_DRAME